MITPISISVLRRFRSSDDSEAAASFLADSYKQYNNAETDADKNTIMEYVIMRYIGVSIHVADLIFEVFRILSLFGALIAAGHQTHHQGDAQEHGSNFHVFCQCKMDVRLCEDWSVPSDY